MEDQISLLEQKLNKFTVEYTFQNYNQNVCNAKEASKQIGIPYQNMIKTIVLKDEDYNYVVCLLSSEDKINMNKLKKITNKTFCMATPQEIVELTGYQIGTVTPLLLKEEIKIFIDKTIFSKEYIGLGTGKKGVEIILNPAELKKVIDYTDEDIL